MEMPHRIVVVGGGFAGLTCVRNFRKSSAEVVLIDRNNYHLFQPLLYQVATGELSPANIASPLRSIVRRQKNCMVLLGEVTGFDPAQRKIHLADGQVPYDTLVVAAGAKHSYFGNDQWEPFAPGLKTIEQATDIRRRVLYAFEAAESEEYSERRSAWLTFVIVGGGPTGVELSGALSEISHHMMKHDFRRIKPEETRIILVEGGQHVLSMYPESLCERARRDLEKLSVEVRTGCMVTSITPTQVTMKCGDQEETIDTRTVIWGAGVAASTLGRKLAEATEAETDRVGRVVVQPDLSLTGYPEIFVIGDLAHCKDEEGRPLPGLAPVAMQQGEYVAKLVDRRIRKKQTETPEPFRYRDRGSMAVIGRYSAIAKVGSWKLSGLIAWLMWLFLHLMEITQFRNRLLVLTQWGWTYMTHDRAARLITGHRTQNDPAGQNQPDASSVD